MKIIEKESVIIIGSGLAALTLADRLCNDKNVIILTKSSIDRSNSIKAQGGIAAAIDSQDNWESHFMDTIIAGCKFNDDQAVEILVKKGPSAIEKLIEQGFSFDTDKFGNIQLGKEGAHQHRRILHAGGDATGKKLMEFLFQRLSKNVLTIEGESVVDLIIEDDRCIGVITSNNTSKFSTYYANHVVLASGGCGGVYQVSSNDSTVMGDGLALAYRAGAELSDLEFIQFHPTMLYTNNYCYGLVSEAVRGEGAILRLEDGTSIMKGVHPLGDLAPRDIVAREIHRNLKRGNLVFLDISMIDNFCQKFPTITSICERANIKVENGSIPVAPGAHFFMGGIKTDLLGLTTVKGLYAVGEIANNGVHGANRLASNSLLEGLVFSNLLADYLLACPKRAHHYNHQGLKRNRTQKVMLNLPTVEEVRELMTKYVGIERSHQELLFAKEWIEQFEFHRFNQEHIHFYNKNQMEIINLLTTCWLIITSALQRTESRGGHYRSDYPMTNDSVWKTKHIVRQNKENRIGRVSMTGVGK